MSPSSRMTPARTRRSLAGPLRALAVVAAAGGVVGAAHSLPAPDEPAVRQVDRAEQVAASEAALVCPGAPLSGLPGVDSIETQGVTAGQAPPAALVRELVAPPEDPGELTVDPLSDGRPIATTTTERVATRAQSPAGRQVRASGALAPGLVAAEETTVASDSAAGTATTPCVEQVADQWLVAGGGQPGRQERLVLVNPGTNAVTVDITSYAKNGTTSPAAGQGIVVPAGERTVVLLDGVTSTTTDQAVRVKARGGRVAAFVVDHWQRGLTPSGLEVVPATAEPAERLVIGGVPDGEASRVVIAAPGDRDAIVTVRSLDNRDSHAVGVTTVPAGSSRSVEVDPEGGVHAWSITSDEPVFAAAEVVGEARADGRRDLSWSVATPPVDDLSGIAVPNVRPGIVRHLELSSPRTGAEAEVTTVYAGRPTTRQVSIPSDRSTVITLDQADAVWVRPSTGEVHASLLTKGEGAGGVPALSVTPLQRAQVSELSIDVSPVP